MPFLNGLTSMIFFRKIYRENLFVWKVPS